MRWKVHKENDIRYRRIFALFPIEINNIYYWLEWVNVEEKLISLMPDGELGWQITGLDNRDDGFIYHN